MKQAVGPSNFRVLLADMFLRYLPRPNCFYTKSLAFCEMTDPFIMYKKKCHDDKLYYFQIKI